MAKTEKNRDSAVGFLQVTKILDLLSEKLFWILVSTSWRIQEPKNFVQVSGHNLESSQTWGFRIQCLHLQTSFKPLLLGGGGGGGGGYWPPQPLTTRVCTTPPPPAFGAGGGQTCWVERGWGSIFWKTPDTALYSAFVNTLWRNPYPLLIWDIFRPTSALMTPDDVLRYIIKSRPSSNWNWYWHPTENSNWNSKTTGQLMFQQVLACFVIEVQTNVQLNFVCIFCRQNCVAVSPIFKFLDV